MSHASKTLLFSPLKAFLRTSGVFGNSSMCLARTLDSCRWQHVGHLYPRRTRATSSLWWSAKPWPRRFKCVKVECSDKTTGYIMFDLTSWIGPLSQAKLQMHDGFRGSQRQTSKGFCRKASHCWGWMARAPLPRKGINLVRAESVRIGCWGKGLENMGALVTSHRWSSVSQPEAKC